MSGDVSLPIVHSLRLLSGFRRFGCAALRISAQVGLVICRSRLSRSVSMCAPRRIVRFRRLLQAVKDRRLPSVLYDSHPSVGYRLIPVTFRQHSLTTIRIAFLAATTRESVSTFVCWESSATRRTLLPVTTQWVRPILLLVSL